MPSAVSNTAAQRPAGPFKLPAHQSMLLKSSTKSRLNLPSHKCSRLEKASTNKSSTSSNELH